MIVAVSALGNACRRYTTRAGSRFARAVRTKSACSTAIISTRRMRASTAAGPSASATTGSTNDDAPDLPATGNQCRCTPNT